MKNILKLPYYFIKNLQYNRQTFRVMKKVLRPDSNCIDIGCHTGRVLDRMIGLAPEGSHRGFEPLPHLYESLNKSSRAQKPPYSRMR